ncbi:hypothetical protein L6452_40195 [Arctium lappa]|uniref:Uncharacterized protein n=1 Tax=Arctium lappa TaxID=4217 RepID=A0ACB8XKQ4_ARCLA|nr:hypothetical protein L6452_40195 [Arctium lappa]
MCSGLIGEPNFGVFFFWCQKSVGFFWYFELCIFLPRLDVFILNWTIETWNLNQFDGFYMFFLDVFWQKKRDPLH